MRGRVLAAVALAAAALIAVLAWRRPPGGGGGLITGRVVGPIDSGTVVLLVDPPLGIGEPADVAPDGSFRVRVPPGAGEPWVVVDTRRGALVRTQRVSTTSDEQVPPMAIWETEVRVRTAGGRVRIDWSPIPVDREGFPKVARYSVLASYRRSDRSEGEATFPVRDPVLELDIADEVLPYLPNLHPEQREVELTIRAFDPEDPKGPWWYGGKATWRVP